MITIVVKPAVPQSTQPEVNTWCRTCPTSIAPKIIAPRCQMAKMCSYLMIAQILSSSIGLLIDRAFNLLWAYEEPNAGHAVNGFFKKTHYYTTCCDKMLIPYRHINK